MGHFQTGLGIRCITMNACCQGLNRRLFILPSFALAPIVVGSSLPPTEGRTP